jgi:hypothetical protein
MLGPRHISTVKSYQIIRLQTTRERSSDMSYSSKNWNEVLADLSIWVKYSDI